MKSGLSVKPHWRNIFPGLQKSRKNLNEKSHRIWIVSHTRWDFNMRPLFAAYIQIQNLPPYDDRFYFLLSLIGGAYQ